MSRNLPLLFFLSLIFFQYNYLFGQRIESPCGTVGAYAEQVAERLLANKAKYANDPLVRTRDTEYIPIKFHLVAKSDGVGRVPYGRVLDQLCSLNEIFLDMDIQFYIKDGFNEVDNSTIYSNHGNAGFLMTTERDPDAINIWAVENATPPSGGLGNVLAYYTPNFDWIVIRNSEIGRNSPTLPHEMGHFFSLLHPFNGWDVDPYDPMEHGNPVSSMVAPNVSSHDYQSPVDVELQDRSNCETAGDFICDTPADYNFGFFWPNCDYAQSFMDPNGQAVTPETKLIMSYFNCAFNEIFFTQGQKTAIVNDLFSDQRNKIRPGITPNLGPIENTIETIFPKSEEMVEMFNSVEFSWNEVAGADAYLFEIDRASNFSIIPQRIIVESNSIELTNLDPDRTYFWRVRPYNEYITCTEYSEGIRFRTGDGVVSTNTIDAVEHFEMGPNPVIAGRDILLNITAKSSFEGKLSLYALTGQQVIPDALVIFREGVSTSYRISTNNLDAGVYILSVQTETQSLNRRITVLGNNF